MQKPLMLYSRRNWLQEEGVNSTYTQGTTIKIPKIQVRYVPVSTHQTQRDGEGRREGGRLLVHHYPFRQIRSSYRWLMTTLFVAFMKRANRPLPKSVSPRSIPPLGPCWPSHNFIKTSSNIYYSCVFHGWPGFYHKKEPQLLRHNFAKTHTEHVHIQA